MSDDPVRVNTATRPGPYLTIIGESAAVSGKAHTNATGDDYINPEVRFLPDGDQSQIFAGTSSGDIRIQLDDQYGVVITDHRDFTTVAEVVVTGRLHTTPTIELEPASGGGPIIMAPGGSSGGPTVSEVIVTAPRFNIPCDSSPSDTIDLINQQLSPTLSGYGRLHNDQLSVIADIPYAVYRDNPEDIAGLILQDKFLITGTNLYGLVYQRAGTNEYVFSIRGTDGLDDIRTILVDAAIITGASNIDAVNQTLDAVDRIVHNIVSFDPGAYIDFTGFSVGGDLSIVGGIQAVASGAIASHVKVVAEAPFSAANAIDAAGFTNDQIMDTADEAIDVYIRYADPIILVGGNSIGATHLLMSRYDPAGNYVDADGNYHTELDLFGAHKACSYIGLISS